MKPVSEMWFIDGYENCKEWVVFHPCHGGVRGSTGIAPVILNLGVSWRRKVKHHVSYALPWGKYPGITGFESESATEPVWTFRRVVGYRGLLVDNCRRFEGRCDPED